MAGCLGLWAQAAHHWTVCALARVANIPEPAAPGFSFPNAWPASFWPRAGGPHRRGGIANGRAARPYPGEVGGEANGTVRGVGRLLGTRKHTPTRRAPTKALTAAKPATKRAQAKSAPLAKPTALGRELLRLVAPMRHAWRSPPDENTNPDAFEAFESRHHDRLDMAAAVVAAISTRPVRGMSDVLDRAIAATYRDENARFATLWAPVLALGGVRPAACDMHP